MTRFEAQQTILQDITGLLSMHVKFSADTALREVAEQMLGNLGRNEPLATEKPADALDQVQAEISAPVAAPGPCAADPRGDIGSS